MIMINRKSLGSDAQEANRADTALAMDQFHNIVGGELVLEIQSLRRVVEPLAVFANVYEAI